MASNYEDDFWTDTALNGAARDISNTPPALTVRTIKGVIPLDSQFGIAKPLTVPVALREVLFGQLEEIRDSAGLPLHTYAILDASKVMGLVEKLEASGLDHVCLFKGVAAEELRDVAPYLVRLCEASPFTRNLFTRSNEPRHLWDREPGVYLRSRGSLDALWAHFRKFVRIKSESGAWMFQRFWEPSVFGEYFVRVQPTAGVSKLFAPNSHNITLIYAHADGSVDTVTAIPCGRDPTEYVLDTALLANITAHNQIKNICAKHNIVYVRDDYEGIDFRLYTKEDITIVALMRAHFGLDILKYDPNSYVPEVARQQRNEVLNKLLFSKKQGVYIGL